MKPSVRADLLFSLPGIIIYGLFLVIPVGLCFYYSFTNWDGISPHYRFIGLRNFADLLEDSQFHQSLKATVLITLVTTILYNTVGIVLAVVLDQVGRSFRFAQSALFLPTILSGVVVSFIWSYMTQMNGGVINFVLDAAGASPFNFYKDWLTTVLTAAGVIGWAGLGFYTTVYIATLTTIPEELYEAGHIDGAGIVSRFRHITLPLLTPGVTICTILSLVWGLKQYDFVKVLVPGTVQTVAINAVERAFAYNMLAYASTISLVLFLFIAVVSLLQIRIMRKREVNYG